MTYPLNLEVSLGLVRSEAEGDRLPSSYEPLLVSGPGLSLYRILEDEIILALPIVSMHDGKTCPVETDFSTMPVDERGSEERENPFAVLEKIRGKSKTH